MITITEALAEIKTIAKRIDKKREFINSNLGRQDGVRDPLEKDGGSVAALEREMQAVGDLEQRIIELRRGIAKANDTTTITLNGNARTISEWLTWRRDIAPSRKAWLAAVRNGLNNIRKTAQQQGNAVVSATAIAGETKPTDLVINIDEARLARDIEDMEDVLGQLDGQLSLKNATVSIA